MPAILGNPLYLGERLEVLLGDVAQLVPGLAGRAGVGHVVAQRVIGVQQVQLGAALHRQGVGRLDDALVQPGFPGLFPRGVDRRDHLARLGMTTGGNQMQGCAALAQQVPVQRSDEGAFQLAFVLHILDQQVRLQLGHVLEDFRPQVGHTEYLAGDRQPLSAQRLDLLLQARAAFRGVAVAGPGLHLGGQQGHQRGCRHQRGHMQRGATRAGQSRRALQRRGMTHPGIDDHQQALELGHGGQPP